MDWKRNYRVAKRFYETLKWTGNVIIELRKTILRDVKMDWKRNYRVAKQIYETLKCNWKRKNRTSSTNL